VCAYLLIFKKRNNGTIAKINKTLFMGKEEDGINKGDRDLSDTSVKVLYNSFHFRFM
jgi:hypothetical protein